MFMVNEVAINESKAVAAWSCCNLFLRLLDANQHRLRLVLWFDFKYCVRANHNLAPTSAAARTIARRVAAKQS